MPIPSIFALMEKARLTAMNAAAGRATGCTTADDVRVAERAVQLVGGEIGREWMIGFAWALEHHSEELVMGLAADWSRLIWRFREWRRLEWWKLEQARERAEAAAVKLEDLLRRIEAAKV